MGAMSQEIVQVYDFICGGPRGNVWIQMGDYSLQTHMFSIGICGCDINLGDKWLWMLVPINIDLGA